jgi:rare lipoprotein A
MKKIIYISTIVALSFSGCVTSNSYTIVKIQQPKDKIEKKEKIVRIVCKKNRENPTPKTKYKKLTKKEVSQFKELGIASYYGAKWNGRTTANGEKLNLNKMTAAHKFLPFGTLVKVTDLDTGKSIIVRINDRGPYIYGRVIDLTDNAAKKLGIVQKGIAKVKIEVIG